MTARDLLELADACEAANLDRLPDLVLIGRALPDLARVIQDHAVTHGGEE